MQNEIEGDCGGERDAECNNSGKEYLFEGSPREPLRAIDHSYKTSIVFINSKENPPL